MDFEGIWENLMWFVEEICLEAIFGNKKDLKLLDIIGCKKGIIYYSISYDIQPRI
ncbi:MAG: hypothetical protein IPH28_19405 [Cytophagaceae bacterium]|nr:hypothetical protein [Cytophagaceae bacterium]